MWGSQEKNLGQKVNEKFFRVDQGKKKIKKREKIIIFCTPLSPVLSNWSNILRSAIFHISSVCEGVWKIAKPHKFGFSFPKQGSAEIFKMHLFNTGPVLHLRVVQLRGNFGSEPKIGIYGHLIFYLLSF